MFKIKDLNKTLNLLLKRTEQRFYTFNKLTKVLF